MTDSLALYMDELLRELFAIADTHASHARVLLRLRGAILLADDVQRSCARIAELRRIAGLEE